MSLVFAKHYYLRAEPSRWVYLALLRSITQDKIALAHIPEKAGRQAEMEFLDIKFDK
jgi:hypothetical protein